MPYCDNCGNFVSSQYKRVFAVGRGDDAELRACPNCAGKQISDYTKYGGEGRYD